MTSLAPGNTLTLLAVGSARRVGAIVPFLLVLLFSLTLNSATQEKLQLTEAEKQWVQQHPIIRVSNELNWPPLDFFDDGQPIGFSVDYVKLVADKLGIKVQWISGYSWKELVQMARDKKVYVLQSISKN